MSNDLFIKTIENLIALKYEGSYWDFKREHHSKENNHKLIHDIICLANNLENREAYLIIGVADNGEITRVHDNSFRRNQQQLNDLVRKKKWEGYGAPDIKMRTITINNIEIDVIVIPKSNHVPYTLAEDIKIKGQNNTYLRARTIYTRNQDSNTAHNSAATIAEVEQLLKYRLGLLPNPLERIKRYLNDIENWKTIDIDSESKKWYYLLHPEFTIEVTRVEEEEESTPPNFSFVQINGKSFMLKVTIKYHSTILYCEYARYVDEERGIVVYPDCSALGISNPSSQFTDTFDYYFEKSIKIQLSTLLMSLMDLDECESLWTRHISYIPIFVNDEEKNKITSFIRESPQKAMEDAMKLQERVHLSLYNIYLNERECNLVKQDLATNLMIIEKIKEYRNFK
ncbi:TPA: ATP-binding protein [Staphylococcus delphini]|nr:ATP-binding protein [Staphylococcus delphini]